LNANTIIDLIEKLERIVIKSVENQEEEKDLKILNKSPKDGEEVTGIIFGMIWNWFSKLKRLGIILKGKVTKSLEVIRSWLEKSDVKKINLNMNKFELIKGQCYRRNLRETRRTETLAHVGNSITKFKDLKVLIIRHEEKVKIQETRERNESREPFVYLKKKKKVKFKNFTRK
jgi:hypothetical protein